MTFGVSDFDVLVIGTGFGSLFFARKYLEKNRGHNIALIEWGMRRDHDWQVANDRNSDIDPSDCHRTAPDQKPWNYTIGVGGGLNCWWGQTPRLIPADFEMQSRFGVLTDWPIRYDDLEPYYVEAENIMQISGNEAISAVSPRSAPYPLPPHRFSDPDRIMAAAQPDRHFAVPTARAPVPIESRGRCCATAWCHRCPVDAKFNAFNGMLDVLEHPNVTLFTEAEVRAIETQAGSARAVQARTPRGDLRLTGNLVVLGANGVQSPAILLRSGLDHPRTGIGICEQGSVDVEVFLDGVDAFGGSSVATGVNFSLYEDVDRGAAAAALLNTLNAPLFGLRTEFGRWRQVLPVLISVEDVPQQNNRVSIAPDGTPIVSHAGLSNYGEAGIRRALERLPEVCRPLPVEGIQFKRRRASESHVQCSLRMGTDPRAFVVDPVGRHHDVSNLIVVGSSVFPTCPPANPSLTVAALALRSADLLSR